MHRVSIIIVIITFTINPSRGHLVNEDTGAHSHEAAQPWLLAWWWWWGGSTFISDPMPDTVPDPRGRNKPRPRCSSVERRGWGGAADTDSEQRSISEHEVRMGSREGLLGRKQLVLSAEPLPTGPTSSCRKSVF